MVDISENISRVYERIAAACRRVDRPPGDVRLVAVSKTVDPERIRQAHIAGVSDFGENRVQEAEGKRPALADLAITWHLIGHLQSNKARRARELFHWVHSIDSERLANKLDKAGSPHGARLPVLLEVNLGGEISKFGAREAEIIDLARHVSQLPSLELRGLMTIPPFSEDPQRSRPYFRRLRELAGAIVSAGLPQASMRELSMGMSHDFEVAIEEGATMVRVGTAIFGKRSNLPVSATISEVAF
jgi:pyridoxal phosphate enzyme (YggS family)